MFGLGGKTSKNVNRINLVTKVSQARSDFFFPQWRKREEEKKQTTLPRPKITGKMNAVSYGFDKELLSRWKR